MTTSLHPAIDPSRWVPLTATPWVNRFATELPEGTFYTRQPGEPLPSPRMLHWNPTVAALIGWPAAIPPESAEHWTSAFAGSSLIPGSDPLAAVYAGHQFGHYVPQLGDGRALLLGEIQSPTGEGWQLQLKGAGRTPYSRMGDGRAVLRSSIREYLASEAMAGLGIPTTRALCLVGSRQQPVYRETVETAAVVTRVAPTFIRFGSFEYHYHKGDHAALAQLVEFTIAHYFPVCQGLTGPERIEAFLADVVERTARLVGDWQAVGFAHGVLNTDNMSILGLTLDYGPFGMMEAFDPGYICNHSDDRGRYAFNQQPAVGYWNLTRLAMALSALLDTDSQQRALDRYAPVLTEHLHARILAKLGLQHPSLDEDDAPFIKALFGWMARHRVDYTRTFRAMAHFNPEGDNSALLNGFAPGLADDPWFAQYAARLRQEARPLVERQQAMNRANPKFILRNYLAQQAIDETTRHGTTVMLERLLTVLAHPFDEHPGYDDLAAEPPEWGRHLNISCSS
jgi:serine/tyrosine/threonine adenylyltransferase